MNDVFINALVERIKVDEMTIEQVPIPFKGEVERRLNPLQEEEINEGE